MAVFNHTFLPVSGTKDAEVINAVEITQHDDQLLRGKIYFSDAYYGSEGEHYRAFFDNHKQLRSSFIDDHLPIAEELRRENGQLVVDFSINGTDFRPQDILHQLKLEKLLQDDLPTNWQHVEPAPYTKRPEKKKETIASLSTWQQLSDAPVATVQFVPNEKQEGTIIFRAHEDSKNEVQKILELLNQGNDSTGGRWKFTPAGLLESEFIDSENRIRSKVELAIRFEQTSSELLYEDNMLDFLSKNLHLADDAKWKANRYMPSLEPLLQRAQSNNNKSRVSITKTDKMLVDNKQELIAPTPIGHEVLGHYTAQLHEEMGKEEIHPDQTGLK